MNDVADLELHRVALTGHCYRMLGSVVDAEDAVQETMVRAWRGLPAFEGRAALRSWLYRIATRVCFDFLAERKRRVRPIAEGAPGTIEGPFTTRPAEYWLEPVPDAVVIPADADPHTRLVLRQQTRLAFVAALQHLPPRQRAVLLLTEVLEWSAAEVATCLETSVPAVNSALQRARARFAVSPQGEAGPLTAEQNQLLDQYVAAFERFDVPALVALLRTDATLSMPPFALWLQGPSTIRAWLEGPGSGCHGSRLVPVAANGLPAFGQYRPDPAGGHTPWAILVLELAEDAITGWTAFLDTTTLFPRFGLPAHL